ncbi:MAG: laccase domain-containing protein, partial [Anaerotignum sp.]|nr:laccase domain-containing protein [Anaerotignum sp.]
MKIVKKDKLEYVTFDNLTETGMVKHAFTTRYGGVSTEHWATMNMGLSRGENKEAVWENYRILGEAVGFSVDNYVTSQQTHTTNVRKVTAEDKGKGVWTDRGYTDVDGLITNEK